MKKHIRVLIAIGGLLLIHPALITDIAGFIIVGICLFIQSMAKKNAA